MLDDLSVECSIHSSCPLRQEMQDLLTRVSPPPHATSVLPLLITEREWRCLPWEWMYKVKWWEGRWIPGRGKGGMVQLASAGNVSMLDLAPIPPLIMKPAIYHLWELYEMQTTILCFQWTNQNSVWGKSHSFDPDENHHLGICLLGNWWFGQGNGGGTLGWEGEKPPGPS